MRVDALRGVQLGRLTQTHEVATDKTTRQGREAPRECYRPFAGQRRSL